MLKNTQFSEDFFKKLPYKPFCSLGKGGKTLIRSKKHAIQYPLIQVNHVHTVQYLIFDIDAPDAYLHFFDENLLIESLHSENQTSNLFEFLIKYFDKEKVNQTFQKYLVGVSEKYKGAVIFWQVDKDKRVRAGKIMNYNKVSYKDIEFIVIPTIIFNNSQIIIFF